MPVQCVRLIGDGRDGRVHSKGWVSAGANENRPGMPPTVQSWVRPPERTAPLQEAVRLVLCSTGVARSGEPGSHGRSRAVPTGRPESPTPCAAFADNAGVPGPFVSPVRLPHDETSSGSRRGRDCGRAVQGRAKIRPCYGVLITSPPGMDSVVHPRRWSLRRQRSCQRSGKPGMFSQPHRA